MAFLDPEFFRFFFTECLLYFLTGISIYTLTNGRRWVFRISVLVLFLVLIFVFFNQITDPLTLFIVLVLVPAAMIADLSFVGLLFTGLKKFGDLTYSVFLWHVPLQMIILMIMMQFNISNSIAQSPFFLFFFLVLTYSVGYASYRWIEQPARKYINNRFMPAQKLNTDLAVN